VRSELLFLEIFPLKTPGCVIYYKGVPLRVRVLLLFSFYRSGIIYNDAVTKKGKKTTDGPGELSPAKTTRAPPPFLFLGRKYLYIKKRHGRGGGGTYTYIGGRA